MRIGISIILLCGTMMQVYAQGENPTTYSLIDLPANLPEARIIGIAQDESGFIWLATYLGLYRYDGVRTKVFRHGPDTDGPLGFNRITRMHHVFDHLLILEDEKEINIIDIRTEKLVYASPADRNHIETLIYKDRCYLLMEDVMKKSELLMVDSTGKVHDGAYTFPPGITIYRACMQREDAVFGFDVRGILWHLDLSDHRLTCYDSMSHTDIPNFEFLPQMTCDYQGVLWLFDNKPDPPFSIFRYKADHVRVRVSDYGLHNLMLPQRDPDVVWLYDDDAREIQQFHFKDQSREKILPCTESMRDINSIFKDQQGNLWISTFTGEGNGLHLAHPHLEAFEKVLYVPGKETKRGTACRGLTQLNNSQILIGSINGMYMYDPVTKKANSLSLTVKNQSFQLENIWAFCPDVTNEDIWFSKEEGGVFRYTPANHILVNYEKVNDPPGNRILGMMMDKKGILWMGSRNGIAWFNTQTQTFELGKEISPSFYGVSCYNWVRTDPNTFWLCSSKGLMQFDSTRAMVKRYDAESSPSLQSQEVHDILKEGSRYWIATDYGLHVMEEDRIDVYTTKDGLPHNSIAGLALDDTGNLWLSTFRGISKRDKITGAFQNFYVEDGLPHNEFNRIGRLKGKDGRLYFSSQNGVLTFDPDEISGEIKAQPLLLTGFSSFGKDGTLLTLSTEELQRLTSITIPASNKYFQVEFALLNYIHSESNRYTYYLEGLENTWRPLNTLPYIQYNNLKAGSYVLHVRAQNPSGQWSDNTIDIQVKVRQYLHQTTAFQIGIVVCLLGVVMLILRYRSQKKLEMEQMRTRISSDLHDEVGGVLSGVAMQMDVLESRAPEHLKQYMQRVAESSRSAAIKMRDVIWSIDTTKEHFEDLLDRMKAYAIELLDPAGIRYRFEYEGISPQQKLEMNLRQHLYLIYKEALHNILKHSKASDVRIRIVSDKNNLTMTITDNGIGINDTFTNNGQGLRNMERRAVRLGGMLEVRKAENGGTEVRVRVRSQ